jgi:hypothetical protein
MCASFLALTCGLFVEPERDRFLCATALSPRVNDFGGAATSSWTLRTREEQDTDEHFVNETTAAIPFQGSIAASGQKQEYDREDSTTGRPERRSTRASLPTDAAAIGGTGHRLRPLHLIRDSER